MFLFIEKTLRENVLCQQIKSPYYQDKTNLCNFWYAVYLQSVAMAFQNHSYDSSDDELGSGDETDRSSLASDYVYVRQVEEKKNWDKFVQTAPEAGSASEKHTDWYRKAAVALKLISTSITFAVVLVGGSVAKGALFFMLAQIGNKPQPIEYCDATKEGNYVEYEDDRKEQIAWLWWVQ